MAIIRSDIYENLMMALGTLRGNKLRSFLTVLGVMIGVITVMLISSIISGIDEQVKKEIESFGTRSIFIAKFDPGIRIGRLSREERMRKELTYDDAVALSTLPSVELAVPFLDITDTFSTKMDALYCHASQMKRPREEREALTRASHAEAGKRVGVPLAESFKRIEIQR